VIWQNGNSFSAWRGREQSIIGSCPLPNEVVWTMLRLFSYTTLRTIMWQFYI
jgi:hypothetical protein